MRKQVAVTWVMNAQTLRLSTSERSRPPSMPRLARRVEVESGKWKEEASRGQWTSARRISNFKLSESRYNWNPSSAIPSYTSYLLYVHIYHLLPVATLTSAEQARSVRAGQSSARAMSSALSVCSLRDLQTRNAELEALVFDLKMRLYYLTAKLRTNNIALLDEEQFDADERFNSKLREHDFRSLRLREENEALRRAQTELQNELIHLKSVVSSSDFQQVSGGRWAGESGLAQVEENRRAERQAASALSQHDAEVIARLQEELQQLEQKKRQDEELVGDLACRMDALRSEVREREFSLVDTAARLEAAGAENAALKDQLQRQELLLESRLFSLDPLKSDVSPSSPTAASSLLHAPRLAEEEQAPAGHVSRAFAEFIQFKRFMYEFNGLKSENALLRTQLERERSQLRRQESHLSQLSSCTAEMTLLESTEIGRLTAELDRSKRSKAALERRCFEAESSVGRLRRSLAELEACRAEVELRDSVDLSFDAAARQVRACAQGRASVERRGEAERFAAELRSVERTYRQREEEVLRTLEQVVARCKGLETKLGLREEGRKRAVES